jgi:hypothetical protein
VIPLSLLLKELQRNPAIGFISSRLGLVKQLWKYFNKLILPEIIAGTPHFS